MSQFPVTVAQYETFLKQDGYQNSRWWSERGWEWRCDEDVDEPAYWRQPGYDRSKQPVTGISFWEAQAFARFSDAELPNEREWELAASNERGTRYPWGTTWSAGEASRANVGFFGAFRKHGLTDVDAFPDGQSAAGIWDLLGNVSEWCVPGHDASLPDSSQAAVLRGGCFWHTPIAVDSYARDVVSLNVRDNQTGIRLIRRTRSALIGAEVPRGVLVPRSDSTEPFLDGPRRPIARPTRPFRQEGVPEIGAGDDWRLVVRSDGRDCAHLTFQQLRVEFPRSTQRAMFVCVCRWGAVSTFEGVLLGDLLVRLVGPSDSLRHQYLLQRSVPGPSGKSYETSIAVSDALDGDALLCYAMDGRALTPDLGAPLRLVCAGLYGYKQVKCLGELHVTNEFRRGWWEERQQYDPVGTVMPGTITVVGSRPFRYEIRTTGPVRFEETKLVDGEDRL